jgi:hypothetical protein
VAGLAGQKRDVGQVHLALRVVRGDLREAVAQHVGVEGEDAGVDLGDRELGLGGVLGLLDLAERAVGVPQDPAVAAGLLVVRGQHGDRVAALLVVGNQPLQDLRGQQRDVAVGDHHGAGQPLLGVERLHGHLDGAARAGHLVLVHDDRLGVLLEDVRGHQVPLEAHHGRQPARVQAPGGHQAVPDHGTTPDPVQDLGGLGLHARALASGQDDDGGGPDGRPRTMCRGLGGAHGGMQLLGRRSERGAGGLTGSGSVPSH